MVDEEPDGPSDHPSAAGSSEPKPPASDPAPSDPADDSTIDSGGSRDTAQWIAGYRIIRKLGEGGMGLVYEAEQQSPRRPVALKVIRGGPYIDEQAIKLFQREVQTLGRLKHPSIAAIYEAGRTDEGQHFFAMELVRGIPLQEYLRSRPVDGSRARSEIRRRLDLFLKICEAINYAHQRGVIHRDLKPSNVLVIPGSGGNDGARTQVKILDFGLARITDSDVAVTTVVTELGKIQGTLPYMSPEQARGNPDEIDLRSDVYSLAVILYEMLTGRLPYDVRRTMIQEAVRVICEESPRKPSSLVRILRGDVETIALKALEKEPARRYQSASALAEDIERHLADQPILARPPSATYQLRKLVARHKGAFGFVVTLLVLLTTFAVTMSVMFGMQRWERLRADAEREKAVQEAAKAEKINTFLQEMLASVGPEKARGREVTVREILDEAARKVEDGLVDQPEIQAAVQSTIGDTYRALGLYDSAEPHLQAALATRQRVLGERHPDVARSLEALGVLLGMKGDFAEAEALYHRALELRRESYGDEHPSVAMSLTMVGSALMARAEYDSAEVLLREALAIGREIPEAEDVDIPIILNDLASLLHKTGKYEEAEELHRESLSISRERLGNEHPNVVRTINNLAFLLQEKGDYKGAEPLYRESLDIRRKLLGEEHPDVGTALHNLGLLLKAKGDYEEAEVLFRQSVAVWRTALGEEHPHLATAINSLSMVLRDKREYEEAERLLRQALAMRRKIFGNDHPLVANSLHTLAVLLRAKGESAEAEEPARESLAMLRKLLGDEHPHVASSLHLLASLLHAKGDREEAERVYSESLEMRIKLLGDEHPRVATTLLGLATLFMEGDDPGRAEPLLHQCVEIRRMSLPEGNLETARAENRLGGCLSALGRHDEAEALLVNSYELITASPIASLKHKREAANRLITLYETWGRPDMADRYRGELQNLEE